MRRLHTYEILAATVIGAAAIGIFVYRKALQRLHTVNTLFTESKIVKNFRNTTSLGFPYAEVSRQGKIATFHEKKKMKSLPKTFDFKGKTFDTEKYLRDHWTTGLVILKRDEKDSTRAELLFEQYYRGNDRDSKCVSWSMCKSVVSACIGIAVELNLLDLEKTTKDYVPLLKDSGYRDVKLKDLLQMSSGIRFNEDYFNVHHFNLSILYYLSLFDFFMFRTIHHINNSRSRTLTLWDTHSHWDGVWIIS